VRFELADLRTAVLPRSDVVTANLTGAALTRAAPILLKALQPRGTLIVSGALLSEARQIMEAFAALTMVDRHEEEEWLCATFTAA
jgi:ribosomal protein L11 methylase PrmA